jgi:glutamyl-Q tRNA(Asp) synthetase
MSIFPQIGKNYRGRFAPSPTGPLHFGSLVAAAASYLDARACGGDWLLRIEDLDTARNVPGAADAILRALEAFALHWDGPVEYQSRRMPLYREALERLRAGGHLFGCACSRREIADSTLGRDGARRYPGTCREGLPAGRNARAFRLRVEQGRVATICVEDRLLGRVCQDVAQEVGDFVVLRADGRVAYQLAVVVDDADQGVTDVVRGADLIDSTPRQVYLQRLLGLPLPRYLHLPVALNAAGEKLSKQSLARALHGERPEEIVWDVLAFLGHAPPADMRGVGLTELWRWATENWDVSRIPRARSLPVPAVAQCFPPYPANPISSRTSP